MTEREGPIPVVVVGEGSQAQATRLAVGLAAAGQGARFSCAAFEDVESAAEASIGAPHLVLVAIGPEADEMLSAPVWAQWQRPGAAIARIAMSDAVASVDVGGGAPAEHPFGEAFYRLSMAQSDALPMATVIVSRLLEAELAKGSLRAQLETEQACEPMSSCLDPGKLYSMALELLLERLGRRRGIAYFAPSPAPREAGVAARGFDELVRDRVTRALIDEKTLEATMGRGEVMVVPWGPLHHVLSRVGLESPGALLAVPLRGRSARPGTPRISPTAAASRDRPRDRAHDRPPRELPCATAERYHNAKERAFIDDVTGVYNARYLLATADNEIKRAARWQSALGPLPRPRPLQDRERRHGHLVGSDTLRTLSQLLAQCVRQVDTLARYGGDEFTILLVDTPHDVALQVAERIRNRVESHLFEAGRGATLRLTISVGVATCPVHGTSREAVLDAADKAMYRAKSDGRNRVCSADDLTRAEG
ncbi:MAG: GGDEF domain-containing protein [Myxococcota bacterium]